MSLVSTTIPPKSLDNLAFRDWLASQLGYWCHPDRDGVMLLYLHERSVLRIVSAWSHEPVPITVAELLEGGHRVNVVLAEQMHTPKSRAQIARTSDSRRLALEAELQRQRLFPLFVQWFNQGAKTEHGMVALDVYVLRFRGRARFHDLALLAELSPVIGVGLLFHLFRLSSVMATRLLAKWAAAQEWGRFRYITESLDEVVKRTEGTAQQATILAVQKGATRHAEWVANGSVGTGPVEVEYLPLGALAPRKARGSSRGPWKLVGMLGFGDGPGNGWGENYYLASTRDGTQWVLWRAGLESEEVPDHPCATCLRGGLSEQEAATALLRTVWSEEADRHGMSRYNTVWETGLLSRDELRAIADNVWVPVGPVSS